MGLRDWVEGRPDCGRYGGKGHQKDGVVVDTPGPLHSTFIQSINPECIPSSTNRTSSSTDCTPSSTECTPSSTECTPSSTERTLSSTECTPSSTECKINSGYTLISQVSF
jgi:hypothetical protein